jgi:hypothetical protein
MSEIKFGVLASQKHLWIEVDKLCLEHQFNEIPIQYDLQPASVDPCADFSTKSPTLLICWKLCSQLNDQEDVRWGLMGSLKQLSD